MKNFLLFSIILLFSNCNKKSTVILEDTPVQNEIEVAKEETSIDIIEDFAEFEVDSQNIILTVFETEEDPDFYYRKKDKPPKIDTIEFKDDKIYLGKFIHHKKVVANIPIINTGEIPLVIRRCSSSGGGMVADVEERVIYPGERGFIDIKFYTRNKIGRSTKTAWIGTNTKEDRHRYTIQWEYIPPYTQIEFDYTELDIGKLEAGSDTVVSFPFTNIGNAPLVIRSKTTGGNFLSLTYNDKIEAGERGVVKGRLLARDCNCKTIKTMTCTTNTIPDKTILTVKAEFVSKD